MENNIFKHYSRVEGGRLFEDESDEPEWVVTYNLPLLNEDFDDDFDNTSSRNHIINAPDFETAVKYAEQHIRVMNKENSDWEGAEIEAIQRR